MTNNRIPQVPEFMWIRELNRAHGATQAFAAMFIRTLDDARKVIEAGGQEETTPEKLLQWAESMRSEMEGDFREDMLRGLAVSGWLMNTHPGFALGMMSQPYPPLETPAALSKFDDFCEGIVNGEHPWVGHKDTDSFLRHWLSENAPEIELGEDEELSRVLRMALNEARIGRLARSYPASEGPVWQKPEATPPSRAVRAAVAAVLDDYEERRRMYLDRGE